MSNTKETGAAEVEEVIVEEQQLSSSDDSIDSDKPETEPEEFSSSSSLGQPRSNRQLIQTVRSLFDTYGATVLLTTIGAVMDVTSRKRTGSHPTQRAPQLTTEMSLAPVEIDSSQYSELRNPWNVRDNTYITRHYIID
ncbi:hypothetical protein P9112_009908 [Eukaryota sp. TZLM1-RC]